MGQAQLKTPQVNHFASLLSYAFMVNKNTVVHKDLGFSAHFKYVAQDVDSSTGHVLDANAKAVLMALGVLGDGWMIETNLISAEEAHYLLNTQRFPDRVSAIIDDSRRVQFESVHRGFRSDCYLSLSYVPTGLVGKRLSQLMVDQEGENNSHFDRDLKTFEETLERFSTQFEKITVDGLHRLADDDLVTFLNQCIIADKKPLRIPAYGYFLDHLLSHDFLAGTSPKINQRHIRVLSIEGMPEATYPAILDELNFLGFEYRWSSRFIPLSKESANKYLGRIQNRWSNKAIGLFGVIQLSMGLKPKIDDAAEQRKLETKAAIDANNLNEITHGFMTSSVVFVHDDLEQLEQGVLAISRVIEQLGFRVRKETINVTEAYLGSLPGHGCYNLRKLPVDSAYASHVLPTSSVWQGNSVSPNPFFPENSPPLMLVRTRGSRLFRFNLHVGDIGHFMVLGPTGAGKSTLLGLIGCQFMRYPRARVMVFDKDKSNRTWIKSIGGDYLDLMGDTHLAPLSLLGEFAPDSNEFKNEVSFLTGWICEICELQGVEIQAEHRLLITDALNSLATSRKENLQLDLLSIQDPKIRSALKSFNSDAINALMGGFEDAFRVGNVIGFETNALLELPEESFIPVLRCVFHRLTHLFKDRRPTLLLLEEAWSFLQHEIFGKMMKNWLLTLRKFNVSVGFISQDVDHVANSSISGTIKQSAPTRVYLPNPAIQDPTIFKKYIDFGLNEQQVSMIGSAIPKREYYLSTPVGNRLFELELNPLTLAFLASLSEDEEHAFNEIYDKKDERWVLQWLEYRGLTDWRDYVQANYF